MTRRKPLIAGNWKMNTGVVDGCRLAVQVSRACLEFEDDREVLLAPPFTSLSEVSSVISDSSIIIAAQNVCWDEKGAFTGEISPVMIQDAGATAAIVGHSERRQLFSENDELINKRIKGGLSFGLLMVLCIGETLDEREENETFDVLRKQVLMGLQDVSSEDMVNVVIAYEPVWAIGTGKTASQEQAQQAHYFIRKVIAEKYEKNIADQIRILYGGSVNGSNVDQLMAQPDIDGALVGGAALDAESFGRIINFEEI